MRSTITLYSTEFPSHTILPGRHDLETFNRAFKNESPFHKMSAWKEGELRLEYWKNPKGYWVKSNPNDPEAILVTVAYWE